MSKRIKLIIAVAVLCIAAAVTVAVIKMNSGSIVAEETVASLRWGMSVEEVKKELLDRGIANYKEGEVGKTEYLSYQVYGYQDIEGANYAMWLIFEDGGLSGGKYYFNSYNESVQIDKALIPKLTRMLADAYESACKESINEEYHSKKEPEDPEYGRYFVMEESLVFISRTENRIDVMFDPMNEERQELIVALKILEAAKAPSPTGLYDGVKVQWSAP